MERRGASDRSNADVALSDTFVVGLGSNLGARLATMRAATLMIDALEGCRVVACSPVVETPALGPPQPSYLNAAVRVESALEPLALLDALLGIERALGRERRERWGPRTIDLDLLWRASGPVSEPRLVIPHPALFERAFALAPLVAVAEPPVPVAQDALASLGMPPVVGTLAAPVARARRVLSDGSVELEVDSALGPEGLAVLAELVARELSGPDSGGARARDALVIRTAPSAAAFIEAVLGARASGWSVTAVTVSHMDADVAEGRIIGILGPMPLQTAPSVAVTASPGAWAARIVRAKVSAI